MSLSFALLKNPHEKSNYNRTRLEEKNLREELGESYEQYCQHVPMFIPRLSAWRAE